MLILLLILYANLRTNGEDFKNRISGKVLFDNNTDIIPSEILSNLNKSQAFQSFLYKLMMESILKVNITDDIGK